MSNENEFPKTLHEELGDEELPATPHHNGESGEPQTASSVLADYQPDDPTGAGQSGVTDVNDIQNPWPNE